MSLFPDGRYGKVSIVADRDDVSGNRHVAVTFFTADDAALKPVRITLIIDPLHAYGHGCREQYGAQFVTGFGIAPAAVEPYFGLITQRASLLHNLSLSNFLDALEATLKNHGGAITDPLAYAGRYISLLARAHCAKDEYEKLRRPNVDDAVLCRVLVELRKAAPDPSALQPVAALQETSSRYAALRTYFASTLDHLPRGTRANSGVVVLALQAALGAAPPIPRDFGMKISPTVDSFKAAIDLLAKRKEAALKRFHAAEMSERVSFADALAKFVTRLRGLYRTYRMLDVRVKSGLVVFMNKRSSTLVTIDSVLKTLRPVVTSPTVRRVSRAADNWARYFPANAKAVVDADDIDAVVPADLAPVTSHGLDIVAARAYAKYLRNEEDVRRHYRALGGLAAAHARLSATLSDAALEAAAFYRSTTPLDAAGQAACVSLMKRFGLTTPPWGVAHDRVVTLDGCLDPYARNLLVDFASRTAVVGARANARSAAAARLASALSLAPPGSVPTRMARNGSYALRQEVLPKIARGERGHTDFGKFFSPPPDVAPANMGASGGAAASSSDGAADDDDDADDDDEGADGADDADDAEFDEDAALSEDDDDDALSGNIEDALTGAVFDDDDAALVPVAAEGEDDEPAAAHAADGAADVISLTARVNSDNAAALRALVGSPSTMPVDVDGANYVDFIAAVASYFGASVRDDASVEQLYSGTRGYMQVVAARLAVKDPACFHSHLVAAIEQGQLFERGGGSFSRRPGDDGQSAQRAPGCGGAQ